ncbi:hypothetical protein OG689_04890 [Kitasatospora sp. NBC_00240]|uniref:hypothetical protein n=1 Tax=Kitasatospora sp. NBC_00240 TaxID=2903567 RepID=UPI0022552978|nr:hypothetical protein [Kitasatospora sp. NBC_00240]MCX5208637.1 hypothetical protein [Kitasatospora sp. NBC_00240]
MVGGEGSLVDEAAQETGDGAGVGLRPGGGRVPATVTATPPLADPVQHVPPDTAHAAPRLARGDRLLIEVTDTGRDRARAGAVDQDAELGAAVAC